MKPETEGSDKNGGVQAPRKASSSRSEVDLRRKTEGCLARQTLNFCAKRIGEKVHVSARARDLYASMVAEMLQRVREAVRETVRTEYKARMISRKHVDCALSMVLGKGV